MRRDSCTHVTGLKRKKDRFTRHMKTMITTRCNTSMITTRCNTLQHAATRCNKSHCNKLQHKAKFTHVGLKHVHMYVMRACDLSRYLRVYDVTHDICDVKHWCMCDVMHSYMCDMMHSYMCDVMHSYMCDVCTHICAM